MRMYDEQPARLSRQHSPERSMDHLSHPQTSSSSSRLYQQNFSLSRSVTLPETQHQSRRSNSYNVPVRASHHENDYQQDGK